jgi:hypothetical protein
LSGFSLKNVSASTYAITQGRSRVGTVCSCPKGWVARLGKHCEVRSTPTDAFRAVAALQLGYQTPEQVEAHNRVVRRERKAVRAHAQYVVDSMLGGDFQPFVDALVGKR